MKTRIIFLRKKYIYYTIFILLALILICLYFFFNSKPIAPTFNIEKEDKILKADITGDGNQDTIYIKLDKDKYLIQIDSQKSSFNLEPNKKLNTLGAYSPNWPMKVTLMDISRDKTPEIFIQSALLNVPIQHIFKWNGSKFENIFSSTNNILGFIDCKNNKTPKFVSANLSANKIDFSNYILTNNSLDNFAYNPKDNFMGRNCIFGFIKYIESLPYGEENKPKDIFSSSLSGKDLSIIGKLVGENNIYTFQDGLFMDTNWDKNGEVSEIKWTLHFKGTSNIKKEDIKLYTLQLILKPDLDMVESNYFKIASITLN